MTPAAISAAVAACRRLLGLFREMGLGGRREISGREESVAIGEASERGWAMNWSGEREGEEVGEEEPREGRKGEDKVRFGHGG